MNIAKFTFDPFRQINNGKIKKVTFENVKKNEGTFERVERVFDEDTGEKMDGLCNTEIIRFKPTAVTLADKAEFVETWSRYVRWTELVAP